MPSESSHAPNRPTSLKPVRSEQGAMNIVSGYNEVQYGTYGYTRGTFLKFADPFSRGSPKVPDNLPWLQWHRFGQASSSITVDSWNLTETHLHSKVQTSTALSLSSFEQISSSEYTI